MPDYRATTWAARVQGSPYPADPQWNWVPLLSYQSLSGPWLGGWEGYLSRMGAPKSSSAQAPVSPSGGWYFRSNSTWT